MRTSLKSGVLVSADDQKNLLDNGLVAFDSSFLLALYRWAPSDRKLALDVMEALGDRVWISNRAASEFQIQRPSVLAKYLSTFESIKSSLDKLQDEMVAVVRKSDSKLAASLELEIVDRLNSLNSDLRKRLEEFYGDFKIDYSAADPILDALESCFEGRIGNPLTVTDELLVRAKEHYKTRQLQNLVLSDSEPVFSDYSNEMKWLELIERLGSKGDESRNSKALTVVFEDDSDSWWFNHSDDGHSLGPRLDLIATAQSERIFPLWITTSALFMDGAATWLGWESR